MKPLVTHFFSSKDKIQVKSDECSGKTLFNLFKEQLLILFCYQLTVRLQPQCGVYLLFLLPSFFAYRLGDRLPPGAARIARLQARWVQCVFSVSSSFAGLSCKCA
jgi:hypothetical protein